MKKLIFLLYLHSLLLTHYSFSQNKKIDSLLVLISQTKQDTLRFQLYSSLLNGTNGSQEEATYSDSCLAIAARLMPTKYSISANIQKGTYFFNRGENKKALLNYFKALDISKKENNKISMSKCYNNIANCYDVMGIYDKSLSYYFQSLKLKQELNLQNKIYITKLNIATVYYNLKEYKKAIAYGEEALPDCIKYKDKTREAIIYHNLANNYADLPDYKKAIFYYEKAVNIAIETEDYSQYANSNMGLAHCYFISRDFAKVLKYTKSALKTAEKYNLSVLVCAAKNELGEVYIELKKYDLAEINLLASLQQAKENQAALETKDAYQLLSKLYAVQNKLDKALKYYQLFSIAKDSLINDNKSQLLANLQENYAIEKKQTEINFLNDDKKQQQVIIEKQKTINYFIILFLILVSCSGLLVYRSYRQKKKSHVALQQKNILIEKQRQEVQHQKEVVDEKQKEILDSIHYAKRIQRAVITSHNYISQYVKDFFILYEPKDIVSGDFYWALNHKNKFYLATADCTGHGVPGAFMSLLNISILNEIVIEKNITAPHLILNEARKDIIKSLNQTGTVESKDGMDCILCCFDFVNLKLEYAAANNSFYIIRNNEIITCSADKMPVGKSPNDINSFTLYTVQLQKGDLVYTLTDGYPDQFGGLKGKKFKYKQLEELLLAINGKSLEEQNKFLSTAFTDWKGNLEQVDDVLLIGIKI